MVKSDSESDEWSNDEYASGDELAELVGGADEISADGVDTETDAEGDETDHEGDEIDADSEDTGESNDSGESNEAYNADSADIGEPASPAPVVKKQPTRTKSARVVNQSLQPVAVDERPTTIKHVVIVKQRILSRVMSDYEMSSLLSIRASQIAASGVAFVTSTADDAIAIAREELYARKCPLIVRRSRGIIGDTQYVEDWNPNEMIFKKNPV